jgi:nucleotide-binding universal stress UspA family protein
MEVVLFHVTSKIPESFWDIEKNPAFKHQVATIHAWATQQQTAIQEFMERSKELLIDQGVPDESVSIKMRERKAGVARDIVREAKEDYDAVIVGRWGISKLKDLVWGSIANKLIGHLTHPALCVVGGTSPTGKTLVAVDTSEHATRTVDYVGTIMDGTDWEITLFHAIRGLDYLRAEVSHELQQVEKDVEAFFEKAIGRLENAGLNSDRISTKIATGMASRAKAIVEVAENGGHGTIVVGRKGLSRVEEFIMGRVSNKVVELAKEMAIWVVS